jgi:hypothetical protein
MLRDLAKVQQFDYHKNVCIVTIKKYTCTAYDSGTL